MRVLVFQHIDVEHPGIFRDYLGQDGIAWDAVELDAGETIPDLGGYDVLWVMGGPMDVWQEDKFDWLANEKTAIREWVTAGKPFLGVCLGHQLLAEAMGGRVEAMQGPEVGVYSVELTAAGSRDPLFAGFNPGHDCLQWHGAEVTRLPEGAETLARSPLGAVQAMRYGRCAYGIQYHVEATGSTVQDWAAIPEYAASLEALMGRSALDKLNVDVNLYLPEFNASARRLYENFMAIARDA